MTPLPPPGECLSPALFLRGEDTLAGWRGGWGFNILEYARPSYVLYLYTKSSLRKTKRIKGKCFNQKSLGSASRRTSTERRKTKKNLFVQKTQKSFSSSFLSLCNLPWGKVSPHKNKKRFSSSFFSLWKLSLRQILMNFD